MGTAIGLFIVAGLLTAYTFLKLLEIATGLAQFVAKAAAGDNFAKFSCAPSLVAVLCMGVPLQIILYIVATYNLP